MITKARPFTFCVVLTFDKVDAAFHKLTVHQLRTTVALPRHDYKSSLMWTLAVPGQVLLWRDNHCMGRPYSIARRPAHLALVCSASRAKCTLKTVCIADSLARDAAR